jgi:hypothetical protein
MIAKEKASKQLMRRAIIIGGGVLCLLLIVEFALRFWTSLAGGPIVALARQSPVANFVFASDDPWQFDPRHGFLGRPGLQYLIGSMSGLSGGCSDTPISLWPTSDLGADWDAAELRLGVFGADDAGMQPDWNRQPWPSLLAGELARLSGRRAAVANYSRPGVGVVQSLVLAADVAPAKRMHLVVLAPTTATLALDFVYRAVLPIAGARIPLTSSSPRLLDEPTLGGPVGPIVNPRVTKSWCSQLETATRAGMTGLLRFDGVVRELRNQASVAALLGSSSLAANWFSPRLALFNLLRLRPPLFTGVGEAVRSPPRYLSDPDLGRDQRVVAAIGALRGAGIPVVALQSPLFPELLEKRLLLKYSGVSQQYLDTILASIATLTGHPILRMIDALERDIAPHAAAIVNNPADDWQLREAGVELYAHLAARALTPVLARPEKGR